MQYKLSQRKFFLTKRFEIKQRGLNVEIKTPLTFTEEECTFENLGTNFARKKTFSLPMGVILICAVFFLALVILSYISKPSQDNLGSLVVVAAGTAICLVVFFFSITDLVTVGTYNGKIISFFSGSPNRIEVQEFINVLREEQKRYMVKKYLNKDLNLSNEQLVNNLHWIWNRNIIDENEFDDLNDKLQIKAVNPSGMGFKFDAGKN